MIKSRPLNPSLQLLAKLVKKFFFENPKSAEAKNTRPKAGLPNVLHKFCGKASMVKVDRVQIIAFILFYKEGGLPNNPAKS